MNNATINILAFSDTYLIVSLWKIPRNEAAEPPLDVHFKGFK